MAKKTFYKDEFIDIKIAEDIELTQIISSSLLCIEAGLSWLRTFCIMAKDPLVPRKHCKKDIDRLVKEHERVLTLYDVNVKKYTI